MYAILITWSFSCTFILTYPKKGSCMHILNFKNTLRAWNKIINTCLKQEILSAAFSTCIFFFFISKKVSLIKRTSSIREYTRYTRNIAFWRAVPHFVMWCIWREWNARCFEVSERSILEVKSLLHSLLDWSTAFYSLPCTSLLDLIEFCNLRG